MNLQIAENLRRLRQEQGLTQAMLAERLGVSYQAVSRWENKSSYPDIELLPAIAALFGVTVDYLLGNTDHNAVREWWETWHELNDPGERLLHLRRMHRAFPDNQEVFLRLCESVTDRDECYRLTEEFLAQCTIPFFRARAIKHMIYVEDEERVMDYMYEKNIPEEAWDALLEQRYLIRGETEKSRQKSQWLLYEHLREAFIRFSGPCLNELPADPTVGRAGARIVLDLIAALTDSHLTDAHPVAGDGGPDLWHHERIWAGITLACIAAYEGETDHAMALLSDASALLEEIRRLDKDEVLSYRTYGLDTLDRSRARCGLSYGGDHMEQALSHPAFAALRESPTYGRRFAACKKIFLQ